MAGSASPNGNMSDGDGEEIDMEEELKRVILECGNGLLKPCDSIEELLRKLDKMEHLLQHLRQAYKELVKTALEPAKIALISDDLLRHTEVEVRFTIASCITEIIRITAPDIPYREEQMKDYFLLVNTAFKELPSISGRSYSKVVSILQTISHCQICVMMLDYELHDLVHEMFRLFLNGIRPSHSESVSSSMEHVMTLMIQNNVDSDESPLELTKILLVAMKKENENVSPLAFQLANKVFEKCANDLKDYIPEAVRCMKVSVEEYDGLVVSSFQDSTQRADVDANEMGVHASSRGEVDVAGNGGLSKLEENDTDNLKDDENFRENHGVLSRTTDLTNNQEIVLDIPAPEGEFPGVNDLSIDDGTKTPVSKGGNGETRSDSRKDENVKPWYSCNRVKNQKVVRLSSKNLTDASCSRDVDSSGGRDSSLIPFKEDSQIKDHDIVFEGKSSEQHVSYDACINSHSENVGNPNRVERELETDDVPVSQKRNRKPHSLIKPEEGYDPSWIMTEWVPTKYSCCRKNSLRNASYEDRIIISKASQSLHSHVGEQLNVRDTQEKFLKEKKDDRVDQDNVQYLLSTSDSDVREISTSKDITVAESRKEKMDKSPGEDFLHGVINGVLQNTVKGKRSSTMALPAKESWRRNIVLETGSSKDSADVHTLEEKLRKTSDKILCANNIYTTPKRYRQMPSKKETHARKRKGKTVISEDLSGDFLIKTLISQSRNESSKRIAHSVEFSNPQLLKREILPDEENQIKKRKLFLTKKAPGETGTGKTVIVKTMAPQSRIRLSKREADSQEASNLQQQRSSISSKEENHSKTRIHAPAKKTQKVTSQGKAVIFDNQTEDISIKTLVSQSKEEARSDEVSDPQRTAPKVNPANKCHGEELVGCKIKVWWPMDKLYYDGKVASYDYLKKKHQVDYDDGEKEILDLRSECWEML